jgi:hypothetical protein
MAVWYLVYPGFLDWVEPGAAGISWLAWQGAPIYPPLATGPIYSQVYGPLLFQAVGFFLGLLGPSIAISKIPGVAAFAVAHLATYLMLRHNQASRGLSLIIAATLCVVQAGFANQAYAFGVRADPWLYLVSAVSILVATATPSTAHAVLLGCLGGIISNLKLSAGLYIAPAALLFLLYHTTEPVRCLRFAILALTAGFVSFSVSFVSATADLNYYVEFLHNSFGRETSRWLLEQNLVMIAFMFSPIFLVYAICKPKLPYRYILFITMTFVCTLIILVPASKDGAGPHHLLPFLPSLSWAFLILLQTATKKVDSDPLVVRLNFVNLGLVASLVIGYGPLVLRSWDTVFRDHYLQATKIRMASEEIVSVIHAYPGLKVGVAPPDPLNMRIIPIFHGNPFLIDPVAWDDYQRAGTSEAIISNILDQCLIDMWLVPKDYEKLQAVYTETFLSSGISDHFNRHYKFVASGRIFDEWRCSDSTAPRRRDP